MSGQDQDLHEELVDIMPAVRGCTAEQSIPTPDQLYKVIADIGVRVDGIAIATRLIDEFLYSGIRALHQSDCEEGGQAVQESPLREIDSEMGRIDEVMDGISVSLGRIFQALGLEVVD